MPEPRANATAVAVPDGRIFVLGGRNAHGDPLASTIVFDPASSTWSEASQMPAPQANAAATFADGRVYVFGGDLPDGPGSVQSLDPASNAWTTHQPMPMKVASPATATLDGTVYLFGGTPASAEGTSRAALGFIPQDDRWQPVADLPVAGSRMSASVVDGHIWVIGAQKPEARFVAPLVYDPADDAWTVIPETRSAPYAVSPGHAAMVLPSGQIMIISPGQVPVTIDTSVTP